jgi:putative flippase GtrA
MAAFLRYVVVGGSALALHLAVLRGLLWTRACAPWAASAIGFVIACAFNYTLQRLWVFRSDRSHAVALPRYIAITTVMLGVNTVLFATLFGFGVPPLVAQTITTGCVFVLNFFANSRFTFGAPRAAAAD